MLLHTGFFLITIPLFYFEIVVNLVNDSLAHQITGIIKTRIQQLQLNKYLNKTIIQEIFNQFNSKYSASIEKAENMFKERNENIYRLAYSICATISALCLFIGFIFSVFYGEEFMSLIYSNLIVIGFVLISEFIIVFFFLDKMQVIDYDFIRATIIRALNVSETDCGYILNFLHSILPHFIAQIFIN
jgi:hypothetical protein